MNLGKPLSVYKFMNREFLKPFLAGQIRLGSIESYRSMENSRLRDELEGVSRLKIHHIGKVDIHDKQALADKRNIMKGLPISFGNEEALATGEIKGPRIERVVVDHYIFCTTMPPFANAVRQMCRVGPIADRYDACVEITNVSAFAHLLHFSGLVQHRRLATNFPHRGAGKVEYTKRTAVIDKGQPPSHPVFTKPHKFAVENEYRIAFWRDEKAKHDIPNDEGLIVHYKPWPGLLIDRTPEL